MNTWEELFQPNLNAAWIINNALVLHKITSSYVTRDRKYIQADGGHFVQLAWVSNGQSVTVHLTRYINKCTMLLFSISIIYCILILRTPQTLRTCPRCMWGFWLRSSYGIKSGIIDLNSWTTPHFHLWIVTLRRTVLHYVINSNFIENNRI